MNPIVAENLLPGTPQSSWDIPTQDMGNLTIQGFASDISVNQGETIFFKVNTSAIAWKIDIFRLGFYNGAGGRFITTVLPSVSLPQIQPPCFNDSSTGLLDCGNWQVSASWQVPLTTTSGYFIGKATRNDTGTFSHIVFIVRNDSSSSDILFQASDTSWQAYNSYSSNFYGCPSGQWTSSCRAFKISYNRPFVSSFLFLIIIFCAFL